LKLEGAPTQGITTVFFDNLYFYKGTPTSLQTFDERSISLYPNPVKNTLRIDAPDAITNIAIFNMLGQEVLSLKPNSASISLQTTTLAKGTYIIKANLNGKQATSTFVKE
jgi:Secretion system C-terminal sorting domain